MPYKDPQKAKKARQLWYQANRERLLVYWRMYHLAHQEERNAAALVRYRDQIEQRRAYYTVYNSEHRRERADKERERYSVKNVAIRKKQRVYYNHNRERLKERQRHYHQMHRDQQLRYLKQYRQRYSTKIKAKITSRAWRVAHPDEEKARQHKRRALKRGGGHFPYKVEEIVARDRGVCGICHNRVAKAEQSIDHILPLSLGGADAPHNVQLAHLRCNLSKNNTARFPQNLRLALS